MNEDKKILWQEYWKNRDQQTHLKLMNSYLPIVNEITNTVYSESHKLVELDDLFNGGIFGLADAVRAYPSNSDVEFDEFCRSIVEQAINKELNWSPLELLKAWKTLTNQEKRIFVFGYYEKCSFSDIANLLDMPVETVQKTYQSLLESLPLSS